MQIAETSSNNLTVGYQNQISSTSTEKTQPSDTEQKSNRPLSTDKVTISPEAQKLAQLPVESDGDGQDIEAAEANALKLAEKENNTLNATTSVGFDIFA